MFVEERWPFATGDKTVTTESVLASPSLQPQSFSSLLFAHSDGTKSASIASWDTSSPIGARLSNLELESGLNLRAAEINQPSTQRYPDAGEIQIDELIRYPRPTLSFASVDS